jgi:hypothetical protein
MSSELPIACSLSGADLAQRLTEISDLGRSGLLDVERDAARAVLRFSADDGTAERLQAIVDAEGRCCPFLDMTVRARPEALVLTIDAPDDARLVVDELVEAFSGAPSS